MKRKGESWRAQWDCAWDGRSVRTDADGKFDEVVLLDSEKRVFHVERMDRHAWWVGLGEDTMLWVQRDKSGKYVATVTEHTPAATKREKKLR